MSCGSVVVVVVVVVIIGIELTLVIGLFSKTGDKVLVLLFCKTRLLR